MRRGSLVRLMGNKSSHFFHLPFPLYLSFYLASLSPLTLSLSLFPSPPPRLLSSSPPFRLITPSLRLPFGRALSRKLLSSLSSAAVFPVIGFILRPVRPPPFGAGRRARISFNPNRRMHVNRGRSGGGFRGHTLIWLRREREGGEPKTGVRGRGGGRGWDENGGEREGGRGDPRF